MSRYESASLESMCQNLVVWGEGSWIGPHKAIIRLSLPKLKAGVLSKH